jgi:hypothetical protein
MTVTVIDAESGWSGVVTVPFEADVITAPIFARPKASGALPSAGVWPSSTHTLKQFHRTPDRDAAGRTIYRNHA